MLTEKLADLYAMEGKPSSAIDTYEQALTLNPSPEQRIRIRLTLGDKLQEQNRDQPTPTTIIKNCSRNRRTIPAETSIYAKTFALGQTGAETQQTGRQ